jgi:hypothetical protein
VITQENSACHLKQRIHVICANLCSLVQQDEDKEDPNERRDADSDMEMNYVKPSEDSARYF